MLRLATSHPSLLAQVTSHFAIAPRAFAQGAPSWSARCGHDRSCSPRRSPRRTSSSGRIQATDRVDVGRPRHRVPDQAAVHRGRGGEDRASCSTRSRNRRSRPMCRPSRPRPWRRRMRQLQNASITLGRAHDPAEHAGRASAPRWTTPRPPSGRNAALLLAAQANLQTSPDQPWLYRHLGPDRR